MAKSNSELLAYQGNEDLLFGIEKQRRYILRLEAVKKACPNCGTPMSAWEGRGIADVNDYDLTKLQSDNGKCIGCGRDIRFSLPLQGEWGWRLVPIDPASCGTRPKGGDAHAAPALPSDAAPEGRTPNLSRPIPDTLNAGGCE